jgi:hypothetical protein
MESDGMNRPGAGDFGRRPDRDRIGDVGKAVELALQDRFRRLKTTVAPSVLTLKTGLWPAFGHGFKAENALTLDDLSVVDRFVQNFGVEMSSYVEVFD